MRTPGHWIYLSPHLDDAVLSCGGLIWEQVTGGALVEIWTVFAGDPPPGLLTPFAQSLHDRWRTGGTESVRRRREEDKLACRILGVKPRHLSYPDCIYRFAQDNLPVVQKEEDLFQEGYEGEPALEKELVALLEGSLRPQISLAAPYGFGSHIDHQLIQRVTGKLEREVWRYADYPYAASYAAEKAPWWAGPGKTLLLPVSIQGLRKWQDAVAAYESQISTFWAGTEPMRVELESYWQKGGGSTLLSGGV